MHLKISSITNEIDYRKNRYMNDKKWKILPPRVLKILCYSRKFVIEVFLI